MPKVVVVIAREYLERVRTKWFLVATVFGPVLFGALLFLPPWLAAHNRASRDVARIVVLDATDAGLGRRVAADLNGGITGDTAQTTVRVVPPAELAAAESVAKRETLAKRARGYLVLDAATLAGRRARYAGTNATSGADVDQIRRAVDRAAMRFRLERAGVDPFESAAIAESNLQLTAERISGKGRNGSARVSIYLALTVAMLLYASLVMYGQAVLRGVIEEKQTRVAEVVLSSVSSTTLLAGKVIGIGAVGLTQTLIWTATAVLMARVRAPVLAYLGMAGGGATFLPTIPLGAAGILLLYFALGYLFYAALYAVVGATVSNEHDAQQAQMPVSLLLVATVVFLPPVLQAPDGSLARMLSWIPFSAPIVMPLRLSVVDLPRAEIVVSLIVLVCFCYLAMWCAARVYRVGLLMYGKRVRAREMLRWMRAAS